jgi:hypothetical protein
VTGKDLIDLGYKPGPKFKLALTELMDAQLEGTITERDSALALARKILGAPPG